MLKGLGPLFSKKDDLLSVFNQARLGINFSDSKERAAPVQAIVGHPQNGAVAVAGQRGFFWAQRPGPAGSGGSTVITFWCPTETDGKPKLDLNKDQVVHLRANSDTQPVIWMVQGEPSDVLKPNAAPVDPCTGQCEIGSFPPPTLPYGLNTNTSSFKTNYWPNAQSPSNTNNPLASVGPTGGTCFDVITGDKYKSQPRYSEAPPSVMGEGDMWKNPADGVTYIRTGGRLEVHEGPTAGTFLVGKVNANVAKGDILYSVAAATDFAPITVGLASASNTACVGRVLGVALTDYTNGQYATIQSSGLFLMPVGTHTGGNYDVLQNSRNGTPLFLGSAGKWSTTQVTAGASGVHLQIGKVYEQSRSIILDLGPQVRTGATTSTPGGAPPRDPSDPGGGVFTPTGPYSIDLRKLPTQKPLGGQSADSNLVNGFYFA